MNVVLFLLGYKLVLNQASATAVATATTVPAAHSGTIFVASDRNLQKRVAVTAQQISRRYSNPRSIAGIAKRANHYSVSQNVYTDGISTP